MKSKSKKLRLHVGLSEEGYLLFNSFRGEAGNIFAFTDGPRLYIDKDYGVTLEELSKEVGIPLVALQHHELPAEKYEELFNRIILGKTD